MRTGPRCRRDGAKDLRLSQLVRRGADKIKLTVLAKREEAPFETASETNVPAG